jgi:hypothetical protein
VGSRVRFDVVAMCEDKDDSLVILGLVGACLSGVQ